MADSINWNSIPESLAQGAAGMLPPPLNVIGSALLTAVIPDGTIDPTALAGQFASVVQQELDQDFLQSMAGAVQGIVTYMATSYANDKSSGTVSKTDLWNELENQSQACYTLIGQLEQSEYEQPGMASFLLAAGIHLTILQEKALIDPNVTDPTQSSAAKTVSQLAGQYATQAATVQQLLLQSRLSQIGSITRVNGASSSGHSAKRWATFSFTDAFTGQTYKESGDDPDGDGQTIELAQAKIAGDLLLANSNAKIVFQDTVGMQIETDCAAWGTLVNKPIPLQS